MTVITVCSRDPAKPLTTVGSHHCSPQLPGRSFWWQQPLTGLRPWAVIAGDMSSMIMIIIMLGGLFLAVAGGLCVSKMVDRVAKFYIVALQVARPPSSPLAAIRVVIQSRRVAGGLLLRAVRLKLRPEASA